MLIGIQFQGSFDCDCILCLNDPKFTDRQVWAKSVDPDQTAPGGVLVEQSDQGLHCLPFYLHILDKFLHGKNLFV